VQSTPKQHPRHGEIRFRERRSLFILNANLDANVKKLT